MKKYLVLLVIAGLLFACKHKKASLSGNSKVDLSDFMESFPDIALPYQIGDTILDRDEPDSALIGYRVFTQFVPDSVVGRNFGKGVAPQITPLGKIKAGKNETYLFVKAASASKAWSYIICLDKSDKFAGYRSLFTESDERNAWSSASLDSRFTLMVQHQRKSSAGETFYKKDSYIFNKDAGKFMLILTESNEPSVKARAVINPIDTLPRKHKFSGDYVQDKFNFISIRDGRDASHINFFVHFEKDDGECKGELKGEAKLVSPTLAHFSSAGDPCSVNFSFTPAHVVMKELEGCGNHRDIKCFFEGSFARLKEIKKKPVKKHK